MFVETQYLQLYDDLPIGQMFDRLEKLHPELILFATLRSSHAHQISRQPQADDIGFRDIRHSKHKIIAFDNAISGSSIAHDMAICFVLFHDPFQNHVSRGLLLDGEFCSWFSGSF